MWCGTTLTREPQTAQAGNRRRWASRSAGHFGDLATSGSGDGYLLTAGQRQEITWIKNNPGDPLYFVSRDQQTAVTLNRGTTWIEIVPSLEKVQFSD